MILQVLSQLALVLFQVLGVQGEVLLERKFSPLAGSIGEASNVVFTDALSYGDISEYNGTDAGITSLNGLGSVLEVLSNTEMNAYGWCYKVDGVVSDLLALEYKITGNERHVVWFYAYAHLDKEAWTSMCVPADHKPTQE